MATYAPLEFLNQSLDANDVPMFNGNSYSNYVKEILIQLFKVPEKHLPTEEWFTKYVLENEFLTRAAKHKSKCFDGLKHLKLIESHGLATYLDIEFFKLAPNMLSVMGYTPDDINKALNGNSRIKDLKSEIRDSIIEAILIDKWVINKQVYKPDKTFAKYLLDTKELKMTDDFFDCLPYNTFYVDLEEASKETNFGNIHGVFVNITKLNNNKIALTLYMLSKNLLSYSDYMIFDMNLTENLSPTEFEENVEFDKIPVLESQYQNNESINIRAVVVLILQLICYMKVKEPDVCAAPEMAHTYKPNKHGGKIMNKYNEVMKHEVGIRIGKTISNNIKEMKKAEKEQQKNLEKDINAKDRKPPTPHFRSAHWHRFWCGSEKQNNKRLELRWIEPTFVCGSYSSKSQSDVVIHKMD